MTWHEAETTCLQDNGAHLWSIESHEEWIGILPYLPVCLLDCNYLLTLEELYYSINPIRSGGGGGFKKKTPIYSLTHLILEVHYFALVTFPKK